MQTNGFGAFRGLLKIGRLALVGATFGWVPCSYAQGPSGGYLLRKAETLQAAGQYDAAATAYNQATTAFRQTNDLGGQQRALTQFAAMEEKRADQLLASLPTPPPAAAPTTPRPAPHPMAARAAVPPAAGPAPQAGRMVGGKPVGLFFVTKTVLGRFMALSYYFGPDGLAYQNPVGLTAAELAATPATSKGRYTVAGNSLSIAWNGYPKPETAVMNMLGGGFSWSGGSIFSAVGPFRSTSQLVGSFEGGSSNYSPMGGVLSSRSLTFRPDGTFTGGGVVTVTSVTERSVAETGGSSTQTGHWSLSGWYLTLTDAQGHSIRDVAYPVGSGTGKATLFNFNGTAYARQ